MNVAVGEEDIGSDGACSWMLAVNDRWAPYGGSAISRSRRNLKWTWMILVVRDLVSAVPSVIIEDRHAPQSLDYRRKHILKQLGVDLGKCPDELTRAVQSIVSWVHIIANQSPDLSFRIEDEQPALRQFVAGKVRTSPAEQTTSPGVVHENADKIYDGMARPKPKITQAQWQCLPRDLKAEIEWYCTTFGYVSPLAQTPQR